MTTPDTTTAETPTEEATGSSTGPVETQPAAAATSEVVEEPTATASTAAAVAETTATETPAAETAVVPATAGPVVEEEDPQTTVFSLVTFFLAALPVIGVVLNAIAVARAGKEGFDLWIARWGLALAIIETVGALALVGLGYYLGMLTTGAA